MLKKFPFLIISLFLVFKNGYCNDHSSAPRHFEATFSFDLVLDNQDYNKKKDLKYWIFLPSESGHQKINKLDIQPDPQKISDNSKEGFKIAYWDFRKKSGSNSISIQFKIKAELFKIEFKLDPGIVSADYSQEKIPEKYLKSDSLAFINQELFELSNSINTNIKNPLVKARNIYRWILQHVTPGFPIITRGTRAMFANPLDAQANIYTGDSAEYSNLFVALCRAAEIPARKVTGYIVKPGFETPHVWAEFYLPKWGWIPVDPFVGDSKTLLPELSGQSDEYHYFCNLDDYHLTFFKGSNIELKPECNYQAAPFISDNKVWYAPIGIWNFNKFTNFNASFHTTFDALIVDKYFNGRYNIGFNLPEKWYQKSVEDLGPYIFKEIFWNYDRNIEFTFIGRELPKTQAEISAKKAARLEINALKQSDSSYEILHEESFTLNNLDAYKFTSQTKKDNKTVNEYRFFVSTKGYLIWMIGVSEKKYFNDCKDILDKIISNIKIEIPQNRR